MSDGEKRRMSSDGQTPKPSSKMFKMAGVNNDPKGKDFESKMIDKMTLIAESVSDLQKGQRELRSSFDSKLDKFRKEFMTSIEDKFKAMKSDFDLELGRHESQIDTLSRSVDSLIERIERVENLERLSGETESAVNINKKTNSNTVYDPDRTIIASNITQNTNEDILEIAKDLVRHLSDSANVLAAVRLRSRVNDKPGLVKISFQSVEQKIEVLRKKRDLMATPAYKSVFLRSSKSHTERLIELNAKTILSQIPNGNQFRITSNGRIVKKTHIQHHIDQPVFTDQTEDDHA